MQLWKEETGTAFMKSSPLHRSLTSQPMHVERLQQVLGIISSWNLAVSTSARLFLCLLLLPCGVKPEIPKKIEDEIVYFILFF
jgi:hypothetical protein